MAIFINGVEAPLVPSRILDGFYTVDTLPPASQNMGKIAFVTDLGNGAGNCFSDGNFWIPAGARKPASVTPQSTITVDALRNPSIFLVTGTITTAMSFVVDTANLYPGYAITIKRQSALSTVLGLVGSLGIKTNTNGTNSASLALTDTTSNLVWDGTAFVQY
jgi:hypothetical protein